MSLARVRKLFTTEVQDRFSRENFLRLKNYLRDEAVLKTQFKFFEYTFGPNLSYSATVEIPHKLGFRPKDTIQLSVMNADDAVITWHYDDFTNTHVKITADKACTVRALLGRYEDN